MQKLFQTIEGQQRLSTEDRELIFQLSEEIRCPKGSILIEIGQIPDALYFVLNGFLRLFQYADNGLEITNHLNCPPGFITPYTDFVERQASTQALECITDCELIRISKVNFDRLIAESSAMKDFSIWVYQQSLAYNETRARDLASLTATQRYQKLLDTQPAILQSVPAQHIASFLGITPQSLSRIRRSVAIG